QCEQGWVQVPETSQSGTDVLTCTGVPTSERVHWQFKSATGSRIVPFGTCPPLPGTCTSSLNTFTVSRPATNVSHLTLSDPPEEVTCHVQFNVPTTFPWTVSGRCDIAKIYSSQNRYSCTWLESDGNSTQVVASKYVKWKTDPLSTDPIVYSATCSLQGKPMPARSATYAYRVKVSPDSMSVDATFNGSSLVRVPSPPTHDCPTGKMPELSSLNCTCHTGDIGVPAGRLGWMNKSSTQLVLNRITREQAGNYICYLHWNTLILNTTYMLRVNYTKTDSDVPSNTAKIVGGTVGGGVAVAAVAVTAFLCWRRQNKRLSRDRNSFNFNSGHGNRSPESPDPGKSKHATKQTEQAHSTEAVGGSKDSSSDNVK
ncbi:hypothetical protein BaRGS_00039130, partial [Batillaria attramentaria]